MVREWGRGCGLAGDRDIRQASASGEEVRIPCCQCRGCICPCDSGMGSSCSHLCRARVVLGGCRLVRGRGRVAADGVRSTSCRKGRGAAICILAAAVSLVAWMMVMVVDMRQRNVEVGVDGDGAGLDDEMMLYVKECCGPVQREGRAISIIWVPFGVSRAHLGQPTPHTGAIDHRLARYSNVTDPHHAGLERHIVKDA